MLILNPCIVLTSIGKDIHDSKQFSFQLEYIVYIKNAYILCYELNY